jgi:chitinase
VDVLTHLNFAFAYIDPDSFEIVTMDPSTPEALFQETTDTKQYKSDLKVFISVGGWTFSGQCLDAQRRFAGLGDLLTHQ